MVRPPYPVAVRLCWLAADHWPRLDAAYHLIDLRRQRPARFADLVWAWCVNNTASDKIDEWLNELVDLLPWQDVLSEAAVNLESDSFMAMSAKGGG